VDPNWTAVDDYWTGRLHDPDPVLDAALEANVAAGLPAIDVSPSLGRFLHLLARAAGARRVLEIGTLGGYSTIWLARAVGPEGAVVTCELDPHHAEVARANLARAGHGATVEIRTGPALGTLATLEPPFDLAFVDADKQSGADYVRECLRLVRPGGLVVVDNVVRGGRVVDAGSDDPGVVGTRRLADLVAAEPRLDATVLQTVGVKGWDGFLVAVVR
jgi:predicted O-methyltransferase YrrM